MKQIQIGWAIRGNDSHGLSREAFLTELQQAFTTIKGHFETIWLTDHLQNGDKPVFESWTMLTYLAAIQPSFSFGHTVLAQSFRNPALLAKMAATLQYLSGGRLILGLGTGWKEDEYTAYGYPYPPAGTRVEELAEALQIIKALLQGKAGGATVEGKHYHIANAYCEPRPDPRPIIMVGGSKPRMLRLIAQHADWWSVSATAFARYQQLVQESEKACAAVGRDPTTLRRTWFGHCICAPTQAQVEQLNVSHITPEKAFIGTPEQVLEQMRPFVDLGVDYFMLSCGGFPNLTTLETLISEVLPLLNR